MGWTASVPADWISSEVPGGQFVRDNPEQDPTRLIIWTYRGQSVQDVQTFLAEQGGVIDEVLLEERLIGALRWIRYHGGGRSDPAIAVECAVAAESRDTHLVLLVAKKRDAEMLVENVLLPAVDSFTPGPPDAQASILASASDGVDYWPTHSWRDSTPEAMGMDKAQLDALIKYIRQESVPIEGLFVVRHGYVVLEEYFSPYSANDIHEMHSATKSVTSALLGIALADSQAGGANFSVETPVLDLLSSWQAANVDERKRVMKLEHLLTMTAGLDWSEWGAAYEPGAGNDLVDMIQTAPDWTQYVLDQPMTADPGMEFSYNSGASYLLSSAISRLTGLPAADYAAQVLFTPLGITDYEWAAGPEGVTTGWGNLRLKSADLAKIGLLYLQHGSWEDRQILPEEWVKVSTTDKVVDPFYEYGYQWWLDRADVYAYMAGRFGQMAILAPEKDLVIVITANIPEPYSQSLPRWLAERFILPAAH